MEIRIEKTKEGFLITGPLPPELAFSGSLELFPLRDGAYLLTAKGFAEKAAARQGGTAKAEGALLKRPAEQKGWISETERSLLNRLISVKFDRRVPSEVNKSLSKEEKETLDGLMDKGLVKIFHGKNYQKEGVYSVSDFAFSQAVHPGKGEAAGSSPLLPSSPENLERNGWMIVENENDARNFASAFPEKVKRGEVVGTRGFDRRFYFVSKRFLQEWEKKVQLSLAKGEKDADELAVDMKLEPEACRALLAHLCESGEVLEKRRGKYARA